MRAKLKELAEPMLEEMACELTRDIKSMVQAYRKAETQELVVVLKLDGIEKLRV